MKIATSRYQNIKAAVDLGYVPVNITLGAPRFVKAGVIKGRIPQLAPDRDAFHAPDWDVKFRSKLERVGVDQIRQLIEQVAGGQDVVLLCFEYRPTPDDCHRRVFAEWWEAQTGEVVEELDDNTTPPKPKGGAKKSGSSQSSLDDLPSRINTMRTRKAQKMANVLINHLQEIGTPRSVWGTKVRSLSTDDWKTIAELADCHPPGSSDTVEMVASFVEAA